MRSRGTGDDLEIEERVVQINRVSKVVKGGRRFNLSTLVVVGDGKGRVGVGMGKAAEVPEAIRKGVEAAKRNMTAVTLHEHTIPHEIRHSYKTATVVLFPAAPGTGVIAGGGVRAVLEMAGVKDVLTKTIGSNNKVNVVKATFEALTQLRSVEQEARRRDLTPEELRRRISRRRRVAPNTQEGVNGGTA
ncbi:MAG TPA: 30S ribosomal protein S5 [Herpetosiphonaceae bacterium]|nr:30S ribosomal protein S5 [Herpetosiphonaceae bacterium]